MTLTDTYTLNNGIKIPKVGFGTWQSASGEEAYNAVKLPLKQAIVISIQRLLTKMKNLLVKQLLTQNST